MADLLNNCRFTAGSTGTGDFADGTADPTFQNLEDAGAEDGKIYPYKAFNATGTQWEYGYGTALDTSGGWVLERTSIEKSSNSGSAVNFTTQPTVIISAGKEEIARDVWASQPIGVPIPVFDIAPPPPTDQSYRYIKLTAGLTGAGDYNEGVLTGESVSGSAPLITATAVIDMATSPLHGQTVHLINTERRVVRAGSSGTVQNDAIQNITGNIGFVVGPNSGTSDGPFIQTSFTANIGQGGTGLAGAAITFNAENAVRTDTETRPRNIGATYFMRIL